MNNWEVRLHERRGQFLVRAQEKLLVMESMLDRIESNSLDTDALKVLNKHFHQLAGAGGIYEMDALCDVTIAGEEICTRLLNDRSPVGTVDQQKLRMFVRSLLEIVQSFNRESHFKAAHAAHSNEHALLDVLIAGEIEPSLNQALHNDENFSVRTVKSGSSARGAMLTRLPDVLVVSMPLPDSDGYDVVQKLRALHGGLRPLAIVIGEPASFRSKIDAIRAGSDAFFEQPVDTRQFIAKIKHCIRGQDLAPCNILLVEDDVEQASAIKLLLEGVGYVVRDIHDPAQFERALSDFAPDVVLLDIMLGEISGLELARFLRQSERFAATPVIFLTTEAQLSIQIESARIGADEYLIKPVPPTALVAAISGRVERYRSLKKLLQDNAAR
jgi:DNA-binding response OmpR family regulator